MGILDHFKSRRKEAPFLIFVSFLVSFLIARIYVYFFEYRGSLTFWGYTSHHLYYGIILLIIAGWIAINYQDRDLSRINALIYGVGLGIFFDEIGLILSQFEDYWSGITYSVVVIISLVLLNIIYFSDFWSSVGSELQEFADERGLKYGPLNLMGLVSIMDRLENKMPSMGKITTVFTGVVLIFAGIMILEYPAFVRYWVAGAFVLTGISYIVNAIRSD